MRWRELIMLIGGVVAAWPLASHAQQPAIPMIGFLSGASFETMHDVAVFKQGLPMQDLWKAAT
jgi:putative tryptophan/tyrosine transport system substrate-binding protein